VDNGIEVEGIKWALAYCSAGRRSRQCRGLERDQNPRMLRGLEGGSALMKGPYSEATFGF